MSAPPPSKKPNRFKAVFSKTFKRNRKQHDAPEPPTDTGSAPVDSSAPTSSTVLAEAVLPHNSQGSSDQIEVHGTHSSAKRSSDNALSKPSLDEYLIETVARIPSGSLEQGGNTGIQSSSKASTTSIQGLSTAIAKEGNESNELQGGLPHVGSATFSSDEAPAWHANRRHHVTESSQPSSSNAQIPPESTKVKGGARKVWDTVVTVLRVVKEASDAFPPLKSVVGGVLAVNDLFQTTTDNHSAYQEIQTQLTQLERKFERAKSQLGELSDVNSEDINGVLTDISNTLEEESKHIQDQLGRNTFERGIRSSHDKDDLSKRYRRIGDLLDELNHEISFRILVTTKRLNDTLRLATLSPAGAALYNSSYATTVDRHSRTRNTRVDIMKSVRRWAMDDGPKKVYLMYGIAGTGKTTIAYSLCEELMTESQHVVNYFCSRSLPECKVVDNIIPTISYQLAKYSGAFRSKLCKVLEEDPLVKQGNVQTQVERLLKQPLAATQYSGTRSLPVVVIDALDECDGDRAMDHLLPALLEIATALPVKFFLTSRPEPEIRDKLRVSQDWASILILHDVQEAIVNTDITTYLHKQLTSVATPDQIKNLAGRAGRLFIYAATAVRYISPSSTRVNSSDRLDDLLGQSPVDAAEMYEELDQLYSTILSKACRGMNKREMAKFCKTLNTVICAKEPPTSEVLVSISGLSENQVDTALEGLRSVLQVPEADDKGGIIASFHASFPDFMFEQTRSKSFVCDKQVHSAVLAEGCFNVMKAQLRFNICELESSFVFDEDVPNLGNTVKTSITAPLSYTSRFWADHLAESKPSATLHPDLLDFISRRLLFWMEVLNFQQHISVGVTALRRVIHWLGVNKDGEALRIQLEDAEEFIAGFVGGACKRSTPHIYISLLSCCRKDSSVYGHYQRKMKGLIEVKGRVLERRLSSELSVWKLEEGIESIAWSPDGDHVACGLENGQLSVLNAHSGASIFDDGANEKGDFHGQLSVVFSLDSESVAIRRRDMIHIFHVPDGTPFEPFTFVDASTIVLFPDGSKVVAGLSRGQIQVWTKRGEKAGVAFGVDSGSSEITAITFSPDGTRLASGSVDGTIGIWDVSSGSPVGHGVLKCAEGVVAISFSEGGIAVISGIDDGKHHMNVWGPSSNFPTRREIGIIDQVAFSRDGALYALEYDSIGVWETRTGSQVAGPFNSPSSLFTAIAFSPDGRHLLSGSKDGTIRTWDLRSDQSSPFTPPPSIRSVAFFPNNQQIVQGGDDGLIRVRDICSGETSSGSFEGHKNDVLCVAVSLDGHLIASGSSDKTVRLWDAYTGLARGKPLSHADQVSSVIFLPDGSNIISGCEDPDKNVHIWNVDGSGQIARLEHSSVLESVALSFDGKHIATATGGISGPYHIRIWDMETQQTVVGPFSGHSNIVTSMAFSPDGTRLVSGSWDHTVRVWDARSGDAIGEPFKGHSSTVQTVTFSPDGKYIASGSDDTTICLWDPASGTPVTIPQGHTHFVCSIAFSPDGRHLVSGSADGTTRVWDMRKVLQSAPSQALVEEVPENFPNDAHITVDDDGWVYADRLPFFWYPPSLRGYLPIPGLNPIMFSSDGPISFDFHNLAIGNKWTDCNSSFDESSRWQ